MPLRLHPRPPSRPQLKRPRHSVSLPTRRPSGRLRRFWSPILPLDTTHRAAPARPILVAKPGRKLQTARKDAGAAVASHAAPVPVTAASKSTEAASSTSGGQGSGGAAGGAGAGSGGSAKPPFDWDDIGLGSLVLAQADDEDAYYAAKVVATKADDHFVLTWADYPGYPEFSRPRRALGLLHPATLRRGR